jgi:hypothetical protein
LGKKKGTKSYTIQEFESSVDPTFKALLMQEVSRRGNNENPYELFNNLLLKHRRKRLYREGKTLPVSALALHLEAEKNIQHSSKLWRNMRNASNNNASNRNDIVQKQEGEETHHVVASRAPQAAEGRRIIFGIGIGINDTRNGINLQRSVHRPIHSEEYYMEVNFRLINAEKEVHASERKEKEMRIGNELVDMADEIQDGIF